MYFEQHRNNQANVAFRLLLNFVNRESFLEIVGSQVKLLQARCFKMVLNSLLVQHVVGSLAAAGCFAVILTYLIFKDLRSLRYVELVFYVSLNDMIASVGLALGGSKNGSFVCTFQAFVTTMNYLSAIFWTTIISYQLWLAVHYSHTIQQGKMLLIHAICWGIPLLVTLLPLTTNEYGNADDESTWCFIRKK